MLTSRLGVDGSYGVDLNRNYAGSENGDPLGEWSVGASLVPSDVDYCGEYAFSEPETRIVRDFVVAHPDITAAISFHTYAELILYPYGYTYEDQPADMTLDDLLAFRKLSGDMAASNGYIAQQASDLYTTSGDTVDWLYGEAGTDWFLVHSEDQTPDWTSPPETKTAI